MKALTEEGYVTPTPIQQQAIPHILAGRDLQGCAQTGTGKTAAFAIPIIQMIHLQKQNRTTSSKVLILTPTRELAIQIDESFGAYGRFSNVKHTVIFGGVSQQNQVNALRRGPDVIVATPGRLLDLIGQGIADLRQIGIFVLDEADRMLDMGFINDVKKVITYLPRNRQTLFFSATMPPVIESLAKSLLNNPVKAEATPPATTVDKIEQHIYHTNKVNKPELLVHLLDEHNIMTALVFTRTKHGADKLVKYLLKMKVNAAAIHGNKSQNARQAALNNFKDGVLRVLVATDIAARGIDIDDLTHVFNYDLPDVPETYIHRIGRTGRAGNAGTAIAFCDVEEKDELRGIEKLMGRKVPVVEGHPFPSTPGAIVPRRDSGNQTRNRPTYKSRNNWPSKHALQSKSN